MSKRTFVGFKPFPWQKAVIDAVCVPEARGRTAVVKSRRQCGKSQLLENLLLWFALNKDGSVSAAISPTLDQARKLYNDISKAVDGTGVLSKKNETLLTMRFINGSELFFRSSEQEGLRGYTISGVLCLDEAVFISDAILELVLPWVQVHKAPIVMFSTPKYKTGFFYRYWCYGKAGQHNTISIDWCDFDTSALLSKEQLDMYREILPKPQFLSEYEGQFLDNEGLVFEGFTECVEEPDGDPDSLILGIDWGSGGGNDFTVVSALDSAGRQRDILAFNTLNAPEQITLISQYIRSHKVHKVISENNSIGSPMTDLLEKEIPYINVERFKTTNTSKNELVNGLQVAFQRKLIRILPDGVQTAELAAYALEYNPKTRTTTYNAPLGLHDDRVIALALAWHGVNPNQATGQYCISWLDGDGSAPGARPRYRRRR